MPKNKDIIANRVFIGCPWKTIRPKYEKIVKKLEHKFPIHFILIGREKDQKAEELLNLIKRKLFSSTQAIFDVTGGNPNVSLEYGLADASSINRIVYLNDHGMNKNLTKDSAIIADLAGQKRNQWKNENSLTRLLNDFSKNHNFTKRFDSVLKKCTKNFSRHKKKSYRTLSLKIIRFFDDKDWVRRNDLVENLLATEYVEKDVEFLLKYFHQQGILLVSTGRYSEVRIS